MKLHDMKGKGTEPDHLLFKQKAKNPVGYMIAVKAIFAVWKCMA
jgi:hypothetical protein